MSEMSEMSEMSVRDLSHNTSAALDRVQRGEVIDITRFGKVIAVIHPAGLGRKTRDSLAEAGVITGPGAAGGAALRQLGPALPPRAGQRALAEVLAEQRAAEQR